MIFEKMMPWLSSRANKISFPSLEDVAAYQKAKDEAQRERELSQAVNGLVSLKQRIIKGELNREGSILVMDSFEDHAEQAALRWLFDELVYWGECGGVRITQHLQYVRYIGNVRVYAEITWGRIK